MVSHDHRAIEAVSWIHSMTPEEREKWLVERRKGIGGSDAAAICGFDPFKGAMAVWLDKTGRLPADPEDSDVLVWGHHLEDDVIEEFERQSGLFVAERQLMETHPQKTFMRASLDGYVYPQAGGMPVNTGGPIGIYEGKTASARSYDWKSTGDWVRDVPMHVQIQVQHNMYVTGQKKAYVAVLKTVPVMDFGWWEIPFDAEAIEQVIDIEQKFWTMVQNEIPPPTDGSYGTLDAVKRAYSAVIAGKMVELDTRALDMIERRQQLYSAEQELGRQRRSAEAEIISILGPAEVGWFDGATVVTRREQARHDVDVDALRKRYPVVYEELVRESSFRVLRFPKSKR